MKRRELKELEFLVAKFDKDFCSPGKPLRNSQLEVVQFLTMVQKRAAIALAEEGEDSGFQ